MVNSDYKVLLIEPFKERNIELTNILIKLDFQVISVKNIETAFKKLLEYNPDIIICQKDLSDYSGFHFYSMLNNDLLKNEIPFILLTHQFNRDDLLVGMELGIDSFLFPPFEPIKIENILLKQLQKSRKRRTVAIDQFQSLFEVTPFGIFEARNNKIVKANKSFYQLVYKTDDIKTPVLISGIFDFHSEKSNELKFLRCLNGVSKYTRFKGIVSQFDPNTKFDIYLSFVENGLSSAKIIGLVVPVSDNLDVFNGQIIRESKNNPVPDTKLTPVKQVSDSGFFTAREKQVLKLSAKGAPIKQIASQLGISVRTVEKHRSNIIHKTKAGNITEAVFYANQKNLMETN
jgi:DNA-binding NarL/FixJ family response regulator